MQEYDQKTHAPADADREATSSLPSLPGTHRPSSLCSLQRSPTVQHLQLDSPFAERPRQSTRQTSLDDDNRSSLSVHASLLGSGTWSTLETSGSGPVDSTFESAETSLYSPADKDAKSLHKKAAESVPSLVSTPERSARRSHSVTAFSPTTDKFQIVPWCPSPLRPRGLEPTSNFENCDSSTRQVSTTHEDLVEDSLPSCSAKQQEDQMGPAYCSGPPTLDHGDISDDFDCPNDLQRSCDSTCPPCCPLLEADPVTIASSLQYHRASPSHSTSYDALARLPCELCGALILRWAILFPCGHRACTACCCSGVNQVSTTPPREHTCAACQTKVQSIALSVSAAEAARAAAYTPPASKDDSSLCVHRGHDDPLKDISDTQEKHGRHTHVSIGSANNDARLPKVPKSEEPATASHEVPSKTASMPLQSPGRRFGSSHYQSSETFNPDESLVLSEDASFYRPSQTAAAKRSVPQGEAEGHSNRGNDITSGVPIGHGSITETFPESEAIVGCLRLDTAFAAESLTHCAVVRMDNIPWTASYQHVAEWVPEPGLLLPDPLAVPQPVHIPLDLKSGKTANSGFIQVRNAECAKKLIRRRNNTKLQGRPVSLLLSSIEELRAELIPACRKMPELDKAPRIHMTSWQLDRLLHLMDFGAPQLKSPIKPIELMVSIIELFPPAAIQAEAALLFERGVEVFRQGIHWLNASTGKPIDGLPETLRRLLQACAISSIFTRDQRASLLSYAEDLPKAFKTSRPNTFGRHRSQTQREVPASSAYPPVPDNHGVMYWPGNATIPAMFAYQDTVLNQSGEPHPSLLCPFPPYLSSDGHAITETRDWPLTPVSAGPQPMSVDTYSMSPFDPSSAATFGGAPTDWHTYDDLATYGPSMQKTRPQLYKPPLVAPVPMFVPASGTLQPMMYPVPAHPSYALAQQTAQPMTFATNLPAQPTQGHEEAAVNSPPPSTVSGDPAFRRLVHSVAHRLADNDV